MATVIEEKRISVQTTGNGTNQTVVTICALPTNGDTARIELRVVSRLNGAATVRRLYMGRGWGANTGGVVTAGLSSVEQSENSPAFGALNVTSSGTNVVALMTHGGGGSNTIDHDIHVIVETV